MEFRVFTFFLSLCTFYTVIRAEVNLDEKKKEILVMHNRYRAMHGVPYLVMDFEMNVAAQKWAQSLAILDDSLTHRTRTKYGENLWMVEGARLEDLMNNDLNPVKDWYSERDNYPGYFDNATYPKYGHFTQVIWKSTERLGVGISKNNRGNIFVVCNYDPKGNIIGEFEDNILPMLSDYASQNLTDLINPAAVNSGANTILFKWSVLVLVYIVSAVFTG